MKILHVINFMSMGGAQSLLVDLIPAQIRQGHQVSLLQLSKPNDDTLQNKIKEKGVIVTTIDTKISLYNPLLILKIRPFLKDVDVVHVHLFPALYWVAFSKMLSLSKAKLVYTEHNTSNRRRNNPIFKVVDKFVYKKYDVIIACSNKVKDKFEESFNGIPCYSIPNGIDVSKYREAGSYSKQAFIDVEENAFISTMVARFKYPKRQDILINAIAKLPDNYHAVFVGGVDENIEVQRCKVMAEDLGVKDRVHFLGLRSDVPEILKSSNIVVMSSEYEGLSLSSLEGMSSGRPFVASDSDGLREVVSGAGILFKCNDSVELSETIRRLATDDIYYNETVINCQKRAMQYDINHVAERYIEQYRNVILNAYA